MSHKQSLQTFNQSLQDLHANNRQFGNTLILLEEILLLEILYFVVTLQDV